MTTCNSQRVMSIPPRVFAMLTRNGHAFFVGVATTDANLQTRAEVRAHLTLAHVNKVRPRDGWGT